MSQLFDFVLTPMWAARPMRARRGRGGHLKSRASVVTHSCLVICVLVPCIILHLVAFAEKFEVADGQNCEFC